MKNADDARRYVALYCQPPHKTGEGGPRHAAYLLERENAKLREAIEDMRTTTQGYLEGVEWEHWNHYHAERFARALKY